MKKKNIAIVLLSFAKLSLMNVAKIIVLIENIDTLIPSAGTSSSTGQAVALNYAYIGRKEEIMDESIKSELTLKKYRKLDAVYLGDKCIIKMAFPDYAKELVRRWNSQPDLLEACELAFRWMTEIEPVMRADKLEEVLEAAIAKATHKP